MTLRVEYSFRQALPIALFGLPMLALERFLSLAISDKMEIVGWSGLWLYSLIGLPILAFLTFAMCLERFSTEFDLPSRQTNISWFQIFAGFIAVAFALSVVSSAWPLNVYHWARIGIVCCGLALGLFPFKWIYFDWLNRIFTDRNPPEGGSLVRIRRPVSPVKDSGMFGI